MKRTWVVFLLVNLILSACAPASVPTPTPVPSATPLPTHTPGPTATATSTPIPAGGWAVTPTSRPAEKGYVLEFTHQVSSGLATLHASAHTCSGIRGPWDGTFEVTLSAGDMVIEGSGVFAFTFPEDSLTVRGEAPYSGGGSTGRRCSVISNVSGPLKFEITLSPDGHTANVIFGSAGAETITVIDVCDSNRPSWTIPFAIAWGPDPLVVPITPYGDCP